MRPLEASRTAAATEAVLANVEVPARRLGSATVPDGEALMRGCLLVRLLSRAAANTAGVVAGSDALMTQAPKPVCVPSGVAALWRPQGAVPKRDEPELSQIQDSVFLKMPRLIESLGIGLIRRLSCCDSRAGSPA